MSSLEEVIWGKKERKKPRRGLTSAQRANIVKKYSKGRCSLCGEKFQSFGNLDVHHIKERSKGGSNKLTNLTILCTACHRSLKSGLVDRSRLKPIMKPKKRKTAKKKTPKKKRIKRRPKTPADLIFG